MTKSKLKNFVYSLVYSFRILFHLNPSDRLSYSKTKKGQIHIYGNGPSLNKVICNSNFNDSKLSVFALNDFAVSKYYPEVKPIFYILVDPAYWEDSVNQDDKVLRDKVYFNMNHLTDWSMTLFIPSKILKSNLIRNYIRNDKICIRALNYTNFYPTESIFYKFILKHNFGVVPVGNILGQAIYVAINLGYDEIFVHGAEHSWTEDLRVNDENEVCTIKKHFFESKENQLVPWKKSNGDVFKMYEILTSLRNHFYGYLFLDWYSNQMGAKIFNCTPGSFIDAFERKL